MSEKKSKKKVRKPGSFITILIKMCCFQFNSYDPVNGRIREWEFADMLLTYSSFHEKKKQKILRKVKKFFQEDSQVGK